MQEAHLVTVDRERVVAVSWSLTQHSMIDSPIWSHVYPRVLHELDAGGRVA